MMAKEIKPIGGYYELEARFGKEYHADLLKLNSSRNSLEYVLNYRGYKKIYLPYYTCEVLLHPIKKLGVDYEFYRIDENLEPILPQGLGVHDVVLLTNYFGIKNHLLSQIEETKFNVIFDNS